MLIDELKKAQMEALKTKDTLKRSVLQIVTGKVKLAEIEKRTKNESLTDDDVLLVINKVIKELDEEILAFKNANRTEKVEELTLQKQILEAYLPAKLTEEEIKELEEYCTTNETNVGGILGVRVTGPSGQSIFLPYSGHKFTSTISGIGVWGVYYSSEDANINFAINLGIGDGWPNNLSVNGQAYKYGGHSIRPVWK